MKEWITGRNPVNEALKARRRHFFQLKIAKGVEEKGILTKIIKTCRNFKLPIKQVHKNELNQYSEHHQGIALECSEYPYSDMQTILGHAEKSGEPLFLLALDLIQNPQNLGTLIRTAEAVGVHGIIIPPRRAAGVTPAVIQASAGASEHLLIAQTNLANEIPLLKEQNAWIIGLEESNQSISASQKLFNEPLVIVVGSEGSGLRDLVKKRCDVIAGLPMRGKIESLNAAVAGSVVLYQVYQHRLKQ